MAKYKEIKLDPGEAVGLSNLWNAGMVPPEPQKRRKHAANGATKNKAVKPTTTTAKKNK